MKRLGIVFAVVIVASVVETTVANAADQAAIKAELAGIVAELLKPGINPPAEGKAWVLQADGEVSGRHGMVRLAWDGHAHHAITFRVPGFAECAAGFGHRESWLHVPAKGKLFLAGHVPPQGDSLLASHMEWAWVRGLVFQQWGGSSVPLPAGTTLDKPREGVIAVKADGLRLEISRNEDGSLRVKSAGDIAADVTLTTWEQRPIEEFEAWLKPPATDAVETVDATELRKMLATVTSFALERAGVGPGFMLPVPLHRWDAGTQQGHLVRRFAGTPEEMGRQHGTQLRMEVRYTVDRVLFGVGFADTVQTGEWFPAKLERAWQAQREYIPERFVQEIDAMAEAAAVPKEWARRANVFPELFHCSGIALRGKATAAGTLYHGRVLDYMTQAGLQNVAAVMAFQPKGRNAWVSVGYAGFCGTVSAMNATGLAMGEMGGRGEGYLDGIPMSFMMREIVERFDTTADAVAYMKSVPRTCEYFYVLSDAKTRQMAGVASLAAKLARERGVEDLQIVGPGQAHPLLPRAFEDVVLMSAGDRYTALADRVGESYGRIDMQLAWNLMRGPVAMDSNLHTVLFAPETLDVWVAQAGPAGEPAYTQPVARFNLKALLRTPIPLERRLVVSPW